MFLQQVVEKVISKEELAHAMERVLADYAKLRKSNRNMLVCFRNIFFLLVQDGVLSMNDLVEMWKNKEHYDGLLAELVFDLLNTWKNVNAEAAQKAVEELKLTVEKVFVGGCPALVVERILAKHKMAEKNGMIVFA